MDFKWPREILLHDPGVATSLPPARMEETAWDILLALHRDRMCGLGLDKLAGLASVSRRALERWLAPLEERKLITGARYGYDNELRAVLTRDGRELLDRFLAATSDLRIDARR